MPSEDHLTPDAVSPEPPDQQLQNQADSLLKRFEVSVSCQTIEMELDTLAAEYSKKVKLPGFRTGKVPVEVVKGKYRKALLDELKENLIQREAYAHIQKENLQVTAPPMAEKVEWEDGGALKANLVVEVFPDIDIPEFTGVEVAIPAEQMKPVEYDEADQVERALQSHERSIPVTGRGVQEKELIMFDVQTKILETKKMSPRTQGYFLLKPDGESEILDLYKEVLGKQPGDKLVLLRTYPDDYKKKKWAGKEVEHHLEVKAVYELKKPELTDDFLKSLGVTNEEEFRTRLREEFDHAQNHRREEIEMEHIFEYLDNTIEVTVPSVLLQQEIKRQLSRQQIPPQFASEDEKESFRKQLLAGAHRSVKLSLILDGVRKKFAIEVTQEDLQKEYHHLAEHHKVSEREVKKYYADKERMQQLKDHILDTKVIDFLRGRITIKEA